MPPRRRLAKTRHSNFRSSPPPYPGHYLTVGSTDRTAIYAVQQKLNRVGCGPLAENGVYDSYTRAAVRLFQARSVDGQGQSLKVDGVVGPLTWSVLFGSHSLPPSIGEAASPLVKNTLIVAATQVGVMEEPPGSNRGPQVDEYLRAVGVSPGYAWCAAFVY